MKKILLSVLFVFFITACGEEPAKAPDRLPDSLPESAIKNYPETFVFDEDRIAKRTEQGGLKNYYDKDGREIKRETVSKETGALKYEVYYIYNDDGSFTQKTTEYSDRSTTMTFRKADSNDNTLEEYRYFLSKAVTAEGNSLKEWWTLHKITLNLYYPDRRQIKETANYNGEGIMTEKKVFEHNENMLPVRELHYGSEGVLLKDITTQWYDREVATGEKYSCEISYQDGKERSRNEKFYEHKTQDFYYTSYKLSKEIIHSWGKPDREITYRYDPYTTTTLSYDDNGNPFRTYVAIYNEKHQKSRQDVYENGELIYYETYTYFSSLNPKTERFAPDGTPVKIQ